MRPTPNMSTRDLHLIIDRGYRLLSDHHSRPILNAALDKLEAARATGTGLSLLPIEAASLSAYVAHHEALRALGVRRAEQQPSTPDFPNLVQFRLTNEPAIDTRKPIEKP